MDDWEVKYDVYIYDFEEWKNGTVGGGVQKDFLNYYMNKIFDLVLGGV